MNGVASSRSNIARIASGSPKAEPPRKIIPNEKVAIANGSVSRRGALLLISPSRFKPLRRFMNEPTESPMSDDKPSIEPMKNAVIMVPPIQNQSSGPTPHMMSMNGRESGPLPETRDTINMACRPLVAEPPIKPFQVFPSPSIRLPSLWIRPPSIGQGPYPVLGSHFPHIIAHVLTKKPGRNIHNTVSISHPMPRVPMSPSMFLRLNEPAVQHTGCLNVNDYRAKRHRRVMSRALQ